MALIPAGEFSMGDHHNVGNDDERPVHTIYLDAYYMDVYEVTTAQYAKFLNKYGKNTDTAGHELLKVDHKDCLIQRVGGIYKPKIGYEGHPVVVTWYGAAAYAQFFDKRLPTEAEWEKGARGGLVGKKYPWGNEITHKNTNYKGTNGGIMWNRTSPVGIFPPNGYGLYDMAGNIDEWCADEYDSDYYSKSPKSNPKGPGMVVEFKNNDFTNVGRHRVIRGGTWNSDPSDVRVSYRYHYTPVFANSYYDGFRCVQGITR